jgi:hypothetical protein
MVNWLDGTQGFDTCVWRNKQHEVNKHTMNNGVAGNADPIALDIRDAIEMKIWGTISEWIKQHPALVTNPRRIGIEAFGKMYEEKPSLASSMKPYEKIERFLNEDTSYDTSLTDI